MAAFCTKCGAPLNDQTAFCTKCGAPVTAAGSMPSVPPSSYIPPASNAPSSYTPPVSNAPAAYTPPAYTPPPAGSYAPVAAAAPPAKSGGSALKIILIIVLVFVGLGVLSAGLFGYFVYRASRMVHVSGNGKTVALSVPGGGTFSAGDADVTASDLGVDPYPGASQQKGALKISTPKGSQITVAFETSDAPDKVVDYYKSKLGSGASVMQSDKGAMLMLADDTKKNSVMVTVGTNDSDNKTTIVIVHTVGS